jgi:methionyl aminopeptidase
VIQIKNKSALEKMSESGRRLASVMKSAASMVCEGVNARLSRRLSGRLSTLEIDIFIESQMRQVGLVPVCKGYGGYKYATCISVNDGVIHGVPSDKVVLKSGDFVKIDVAGSYKNYCADMTRYFFIGTVSPEVKRLAAAAQRALDAAIGAVAPGNCLSDVSAAIQREIERDGYGVVKDFAGHGIGKKLHEEPQVLNFGVPGEGPILREGMVFAIEPMLTQYDSAVKVLEDGWTVKTVDGGLAAHVEDTVAVVRNGAKVLTR